MYISYVSELLFFFYNVASVVNNSILLCAHETIKARAR